MTVSYFRLRLSKDSVGLGSVYSQGSIKIISILRVMVRGSTKNSYVPAQALKLSQGKDRSGSMS
ncbi:hypothetical protein OSCI_2890009 [Kamptonema sp. PCC 6506]|nr:hypothetical protein OSCI_2890009 [Kamptonema sp. PCC 6506]